MKLDKLKIYLCNLWATPCGALIKMNLFTQGRNIRKASELYSPIRGQYEVTWSEATNQRQFGTFLMSPAVNWNSSRLITLSPFWKKNRFFIKIWVYIQNSKLTISQRSNILLNCSKSTVSDTCLNSYFLNSRSCILLAFWAHLLELVPIDHTVTVFVKLPKSRCYLLLAGSLWPGKRVINFQLLPSCIFAALLMPTQISLFSFCPKLFMGIRK